MFLICLKDLLVNIKRDERNMKLYFKLSLLIILSASLIVGCSNNEEESDQTDEEENSSQETNDTDEEESEGNNGTSEDSSDELEENGDDSENSSGNNDTHVEHQEGLTMGETGIVVDNSENRYEVTLNSVRYEDSIAGMDAGDGAYVVANMTVKNIGDQSFNAINMYEPGFGHVDEMQATLNPILIDLEDLELDLLEGEIAPEESVTGDHVFEINEKEDEYLFVIGGSGHQIITYANWDVLESEVE